MSDTALIVAAANAAGPCGMGQDFDGWVRHVQRIAAALAGLSVPTTERERIIAALKDPESAIHSSLDSAKGRSFTVAEIVSVEDFARGDGHKSLIRYRPVKPGQHTPADGIEQIETRFHGSYGDEQARIARGLIGSPAQIWAITSLGGQGKVKELGWIEPAAMTSTVETSSPVSQPSSPVVSVGSAVSNDPSPVADAVGTATPPATPVFDDVKTFGDLLAALTPFRSVDKVAKICAGIENAPKDKPVVASLLTKAQAAVAQVAA